MKAQRGIFFTRGRSSPTSCAQWTKSASEFGLEDGLADTTTWGRCERNPDLKIPDGHIAGRSRSSQILDPAAGTGTFLVEVIDVIWQDDGGEVAARGPHGARVYRSLWNEYVPKHLLPRLHGSS